MSPTCGCLLGLILLSVFPAYGQAAKPDSTEQTILHANVRRVLVDVVVTNSQDEPVTALPREQFQVFEDGHPQALTSFEEHAGLPDLTALQAKLPPNTFSNLPLAKAGDAANILLLDALNTQMEDQSYVHAQMIKYINGIRPGTRLAIFTLGERLRFIQGFTGDPAMLMAAVNGQKSAGNPELSSLLQTSGETDANNRAVAQMQEMAAATGSAQMQASAAALQDFQEETASSQTGVRIQMTLEAMQQLALYLQGIPGRKNVIWFSGSFPLGIFPDFNKVGSARQYQEEVEKTANLLSAAQVAIYPIGAQGLAVDRHFDFSGPQSPKIATAQRMTQYQVSDLQAGSMERTAAFASMDELARDTGGEALYSTNDLNSALDRVLNHGTHYYTLTYAPPNKNMDGRLRRIQVKVSGGSYHLSYRRGYYAKDEAFVQAAKSSIAGDPLRPLMDHGTPDSTAIVYAMRVLPANPQPAPGSARAGDNENLKGPVTRYAVNFTVPVDHLTLDPAPDGIRHGSVEVTVAGYDRDGKPLNWMVRMLQLTVRPDRYAAVQASGLSFNLEMDVPAADVYLRSGVYDQGSSKAGTLEIPLAALVAEAAAPAAPAVAARASAPVPVSIAPASSVPVSSVSRGSNVPASLALAAGKELEGVDIPKYCSDLPGKEEPSESLTAVCEFVLNLRTKLSDVMCERETTRYWMTDSLAFLLSGSATDLVQRSDLVKVHVTYQNGQEYYSDFRRDGQPVPAGAPGLAGAWSHGEFATLLASIFAPSSKTQFHYSKQTKLHSIPVFVFDFKVAAQNNHLYFLESSDQIWFPEYKGSIWIDARTSSLLRLQLETKYMPSHPISHAKAEIEYSNLFLGDGSSMVLPTDSKDLICDQPPYGCTRSVIKFTDWHKFRAKANLVTPTD